MLTHQSYYAISRLSYFSLSGSRIPIIHVLFDCLAIRWASNAVERLCAHCEVKPLESSVISFIRSKPGDCHWLCVFAGISRLSAIAPPLVAGGRLRRCPSAYEL